GNAFQGKFSSEVTANGEAIADYTSKLERFRKAMAKAKSMDTYVPGWSSVGGSMPPVVVVEDDDVPKKKLTAFEKLVKEAEKLRNVLEDDALKDVQSGRAISFPDSLIEKWNKLYSVIS